MLWSVMKGYTKEQLVKDIVAGIIVAIIALPLSIALALASGVTPERGIYTAITAGFVISFLGGSRVQIAGPTAAFATIVAGIAAENGIEGLALATVMAGIILIIMGVCRMGSLIKYIPYTITTGFTAGIAVTIFIGQIKDFLGLTVVSEEPLIETMDKLVGDIRFISTINVQAVIVGAVCLAILIVWPMINETIPPSLLAVIAGIAMVKGLHMPVNTIGDLYTISNALPALTVPVFNFDMVQKLLPDAKNVGILYCSAEANSVYQAEQAQKYLEKAGINVKTYTAADSNDIQQVVTKAADENDAIYIPTDNTIASNMEIVKNVTVPAKVPVIAGEENMCSAGGLATLSISYESIGYNAGLMAYDILVNGKNPADMPIQYADDVTLKYNADIASELGIEIPDDMVAIEKEDK